MKLTWFAGLLLFSLPLAAREDATRQDSWTGTLRPGARLSIDHRQGDVIIRTSPSNAVTIAMRIRVSAPTRAEADRLAQAIRMEVKESSAELNLRTTYPERSLRDISYSASYEITMPESAPLRAVNRFGAVRVTGLKADADIRNANGSLATSDGRGIHRLDNRFGSIEVRNHTGDVSIVNANAPVTVRDVTGGLDIRTRFGNVSVVRVSSFVRLENGNADTELSDIAGEITARSAFGAILIERARAGVTADNTNGRVDVRDVAGVARLSSAFDRITLTDARNGAQITNRNGEIRVADIIGDVRVNTSFGNITANRIKGTLTAENRNGSIDAISIDGPVHAQTSFAGVLIDRPAGGVTVSSHNGPVTVRNPSGSGCRPLDLSTKFGDIQVDLPANANYDLTASTRFGQIQSDYPLARSGWREEESMNGKIGSGGCGLRLKDENGSIRLRRADGARAAVR